jgi:hypothetical protein
MENRLTGEAVKSISRCAGTGIDFWLDFYMMSSQLARRATGEPSGNCEQLLVAVKNKNHTRNLYTGGVSLCISTHRNVFMKNLELDKQLSELLTAFPKEEVLEYYPRHIITPHGYLTPLYFSLINFYFINYREPYAHSPELLKRRDARRLFSKVLTDKIVPTYFMDATFLDVVDQTDLLETFTFSQLHFPMPGFLLVLPHEWITQNAGANIPFVMVSTFNGFLHITQDVLNDDGSFSNAASTVRYEKVEDSISAVIKFRERLDFATEDTALINAITPDHSEVHVYIFELVMKLLIILSTQPRALIDSLDEPPARKQRVRKNGTIKADALWNPCFIGKGYSAKRVGDSSGCGSPMRMHWRRGHLRNQRYGPDWSLVRVIWIEPVLVHGELLTATNPPVDAD